MKTASAILALAAACLLAACNNSSEIGSSIVQDRIDVVVDSAFTVTGHSQPIGKVQSRTVSQLLGRIDAPGFGRLQSDVVTQFMSSSELVTENVVKLDSLMLYFFMPYDNFVGDSIAPMGLSIHRLTKMLPSPIYSDFDPAGYYDPEPMASFMYNAMNLSADTMVLGQTGLQYSLRMPDAFMHELYDAYKQNPANFASPTAFAQNVFKGFYIRNSYGSGRLMRITSTMMSLYYDFHDTEADTILVKQGNYFAVTPEIVCNNDVQMEISPDVMARVDAGEAIVMGPVGLEVQIRFPAPEIIASYRSGENDLEVLNNLTFTLPASVVPGVGDIVNPDYLLLVLSSEKDNFFANNRLPDSKTSFYSTYSTATGQYSFGDMRNYLLSLLEKDNITEADYTFTITPVSAAFEASNSGSYYYYRPSQTLVSITPYMAAPTMGILHLDKAKIKLTYSTQTIDK